MKKFVFMFMLFTLTLAGMGCSGMVYVTERPAEVVYVRPAVPGAGYVWVDGDWYWSGGRYAWRNGYWSHPRGGQGWIRGSWQHRGRGYYWQKGRWG